MRPVTLPPLPAVPLVSVLTLVYNQEAFVAESIDSVLALDWPADRLQHVVINDGSTDGTARALDPYRDNPRVTIVEQANVGSREATNRGMAMLRGDVFTFVAGDDAALPNRARCLVEALQREPAAGLVYSDAELIDGDGALIASSFIDAVELPRAAGRIRGRLISRNVVPGVGMAMRAEMLPLIHPSPDHAPWEDYFWAWTINGVAEIAHVPEVTYRYRFHGGNLSLGARGAALESVVDQELPFRRFMLSDVAAGEMTEHELIWGIQSLWQLANAASEQGRASLAPSSAGRAEGRAWIARAVAAARAGDRDGAALACCRVASLDPMAAALVAVVRDLSAPRPQADRAVLDGLGARRFAVLADAGLLLARPELLRAYGEAFGPDDDATLVIHGAGDDWERLASAIPQLVGDCGLDGEEAPDMVFTTESPERLQAIAAAADAALGLDLFDAGLVAFDVADVGALPLLAGGRPGPVAERAAA